MKKILAMVLALTMIFALCVAAAPAASAAEPVKAGFIFLHDETSTYDLNFINGAREACEKLGIEYIFKTNIPEGQEAADAAEELIDEGCNFIFADSFGHESFLMQVAKDYPEVQFCHATGTQAHTAGLDNYHYEGRFLGGVAAGLKLNEMIESGKITADQAKVGYIGAYPYAEVKSGYTSFFLGVRYVCPSATMEVTFTNSWYDPTLEKEGAIKLISNGCVLLSEHADSMGAPTECQDKGVPFVFYNGSAANDCPDASGSVKLTEINDKAAAAGTAEKLAEVQALLESGELKVFDTATWTVNGQTLTEYMADVDDMGDFAPDTNVIADGYFHESEYRSAPYFDIDIDGITNLDA